MMTSTQAREAFDLTKEPQKVRDRYGMNRFGQCCLLARRLVENGVRFITINTFLTVFNEVTWDIHGSKPFTSIAGMKDIICPMYDRAYSALIEDLAERGMLDSTMVCNLQEFGRTPRVNPGRRTRPLAAVLHDLLRRRRRARGPRRRSERPGRRCPGRTSGRPGDVVATIFHSLGFDLEAHLPGPNGRPFPLVDFGHREIHELF